MDRIIELVNKEKEILAQGEFFKWLAQSDPNDLGKLRFIPGMYSYVMAFRDLLHLIEGRPESELQRAINAYVAEDASHYQWYIEDLQKVLNRLELKPVEPPHLYDRRLLPSRRAIYRMIGYAMSHEDVMLRIILILIFESTGEVFLRHTRMLMNRLGLDEELGYFGTHHYEDEVAHTVQIDELKVYKLSDEQVAVGLEMVEAAFAEYRGLFQSWRDWAAHAGGEALLYDGRALDGSKSKLIGAPA